MSSPDGDGATACGAVREPGASRVLTTVINAVLAVPFIGILYSWHARARKTPGLDPLPTHGSFVHQLFHEYDIVGMVLFVGGLALILVPVTMAKGLASKWDGSNIAMLCVGLVCIVLFVVW